MRKTALTGLLIIISLISVSSPAKINFQKSEQDSIEIETLDIDKESFFEFVRTSIFSRKPGLGKYGRVAFYPCDMKIADQKIIEYKNKDGEEIRFLSNPSCHQIILRRVLENSYQYNKNGITGYQNRQCLLTIEKIISPMLEYYTIKYEERNKGNCNVCEFKEKERLNLILSTQKKILEHCQSESQNVMNFISELDSQIEANYKAKTSQ